MNDSEGMKRSVDDDDDNCIDDMPNKRSRGDGDRIELRILIQSKNAGAIIGKGGSNISRLRADYKASITVPDCPGPERILTVSSDLDTVCDVLLDIIPKLEDYVQYKTLDFDCEVHMLVHQSQAGCIIGRAGFKIKELREKTGAIIKVYSNCCPQSTDRVVQISGTPSVVVDCARQIFELIQQSPIKGPHNPYDPHNCDEFYSQEYGGFTEMGGNRRGMSDRPSRGMRGGRGGGGMRGMGDMGGDRGLAGGNRMSIGGMLQGLGGMRDMDMDSMPRRGMGGGRGGLMSSINSPSRGFRNGGMGGRGGGGGNLMGNRSQGGGYGSMGRGMGNGIGGNNLLGGMGGMSQNSLGGGGGGGGYSPPGGGYSNMGNQNMGNQGYGGQSNQMGGDGGGGGQSTSTQVTIPKDLAGSIIGKGGMRIRKIRQDSGAGITIDEALPGSSDRIITITGSQSQIQMAQYLLQQRYSTR